MLILATVTVIAGANAAGAAPDNLITLDAEQDVGRHSSVAIDSQGRPVVAYYDAHSESLRVIRCLDVDCEQTHHRLLDSAASTGEHPAIVLDSADRPVIAYTATTASILHDAGLRVVTCADPDCANSEIQVIQPDIDVTPSLAITSDDRPVISLTTGGFAGGFVCADTSCADREGLLLAVSTSSVSVALADDEIPAFAYIDDANGRLTVARCVDAGCGDVTLTTVDDDMDTFANFDVTLDDSGAPVAAYRAHGTEQLEIVRCADVECSTSTAHTQDSQVDPSSDIVVRLDRHDRPVVAYQPYLTDDLAVHQCLVDDCRGGSLERRPVTTAVHGRTLGMAIDASGDAMISWYDDVQADLGLVQCAGHGCGSIPVIPSACDLDPATATVIHGTEGRDVIDGTPGDDIVFGHRGADIINGLEGHDCLIGGKGRDTIDGDDGNDLIIGNGGRDTLAGGRGSDRIKAGKGGDQVAGGKGNDILNGGSGGDGLNGGSGHDTIRGKSGNDVLQGGSGIDTLQGGKGTDQCSANGGTESGCES